MNQSNQKSLYGKFLLVNLALLLVPITFLTGYAIINVRSSVDYEVIQKLHTTGKEIQAIITDYKENLDRRAVAFAANDDFTSALVKGSLEEQKNDLAFQFRSDTASTQSFYDVSGKLLLSLFRQNGDVGVYVGSKADGLTLKAEFISEILERGSHHRIETTQNIFQFVMVKPIFSVQKSTIGYVEQTLDLSADFANKMRDRLGYEFLFFDEQAQTKISTHEDLSIYPQSFYLEKLNKNKLDYFDLTIRGKTFAFLIYPLSWDKRALFLAVGADKTETISAFKENTSKLIAVSLILAVLFTILMALYAKLLLKPLFELLGALSNQIKNNNFNEIPVKDESEIGALNKKINYLLRALGGKNTGP